jgi:agmatine deiminase
MLQILPEWYVDTKVLLIWPHKNSDWNADLKTAKKQFFDLLKSINKFDETILVGPLNFDHKDIENISIPKENIILIPTNDTWCRDFGLISCKGDKNNIYVDFEFNGYGKYEYGLDNMLNNALAKKLSIQLTNVDLVFEGGNLETDGNGVFIFSTNSVLIKNRQLITKEQFETKWKDTFFTKNIIWINDLNLKNDDTDGHIDNFVRFIDEKTICYLDEEHILSQLKTHFDSSYTLLPIPKSLSLDEPQSYLNFLHTKNQILIPSYGNLDIENKLVGVFKKFHSNVHLVDSTHLVKQGGGVHCSTMQIAL